MALPSPTRTTLRRPLELEGPSTPGTPLNSVAMSMPSPALMRESLSKVSDTLSFSIFERVETGSPVRALTCARVQPFWRRTALRAAPGLAIDRGIGGSSAARAAPAAPAAPAARSCGIGGDFGAVLDGIGAQSYP